ncbi:MAG: hypothetical protein H6738_16530 [Alphaproteobacteria bacterium]|nr:hypothetical protein [Alphaproteobacteria bacterium]MCB9698388.1 hypothetical protein [Alphaproteobacteria bacterium]
MSPVTPTPDGFEARLALGEDVSRGPLAVLALVCGGIVFAAALSGTLDEKALFVALVIYLGIPAAMWWRMGRAEGELWVVVRGPRLEVHDRHGTRGWLLVELGSSPMTILGDYLTMRCPDGSRLTWDVRSVDEAHFVVVAMRRACAELATRADPRAAPEELHALRSLVERNRGGGG